MTRKQDKVISLITELASTFINRESNRESLITVTYADISPNLKSSTIYLSVYPEAKEDTAIEFLKRKRSEFREFVKNNSRLRVLPVFEFDIDRGEKNRQKIDELSREAGADESF